MKLEDYFEIVAADDIRIRGHRIGIETVLYEYVHRARTPEEIQERYPALSLEEVYATILYYLHDRQTVGGYLNDYLEHCRASEEEFDRNPPPGVVALRQRIEQARAENQDEDAPVAKAA